MNIRLLHSLLPTLVAVHVLGALTSCSNVGPSTQAELPAGASSEQDPLPGVDTLAPGGTAPTAGSAATPNGEQPLAPELPLNGPAPAEGSSAVARFLSDTCASSELNGWGPLERDLSNGEEAAADGGPISLGGVLHAKGLGTHAPSEVSFALGGSCSHFSALAGIDAEMKRAGSVQFQVLGDGQLLAETAPLTGADAPSPLEVDITGVQELRLVVTGGADTGSDHADWADAKVLCQSAGEACALPARAKAPVYDGYDLAWADEFDVDGAPNPNNWSFENGFVRNEEAQWYQPDNARVQGGFLVIEGRRERVPNPNYRAGSGDWKTNRPFAEYTSSSLHSRGKQSFRFGRLEMRARFPAYTGLWPAWWMLGNDGEWPSNGEIDILEFYQGALHANFVAGTNTRYEGNWDAIATPLASLGDADWDARFHVYRMDWNDQRIVLAVDGKELNSVELAQLRNPDGQSPFLNPEYTLLNLALGGVGGDPSGVAFPVHYEVDYVRVYQPR